VNGQLSFILTAIKHDPEKWMPVSRLREALGTIRRVA
jgi:hypothetical protein